LGVAQVMHWKKRGGGWKERGNNWLLGLSLHQLAPHNFYFVMDSGGYRQ
jgi:hypothetical protein